MFICFDIIYVILKMKGINPQKVMIEIKDQTAYSYLSFEQQRVISEILKGK